MNIKDNFVDKIGLEKTVCQLAAAEYDYAFAFYLLEFLNEGAGISSYDLNILIRFLARCQGFGQLCSLFPRARKNIVPRAGIRGLAGSEHYFISLSPDQESINRLHELCADLGDLIAPMKPIVAAILARDVIVETIGEAEGDFAHAATSGAAGFVKLRLV